MITGNRIIFLEDTLATIWLGALILGALAIVVWRRFW